MKTQPKAPHESPLINTKETAQLTGLHERTITRLCASGEIPATKLGRRWLVNRSALLAQLGIEA